MPGGRKGVAEGAAPWHARSRGARACSSADLRTPRKVVAMRSRITRRLVVAVAIAALAVPAGIAVATPPSGITATVLGQGTFSERVKVKTPNIKAKIKPSEFVVQDIVVAPGGHTGWHSHPGPAL